MQDLKFENEALSRYKIEIVPVSKIRPNKNNPRTIDPEQLERLVKSIQDFPDMMYLRPIVVNSDMTVLGGNMRLKALKKAGVKQAPIIIANDLDEARQIEFIIKDNVAFGSWDYGALADFASEDELEQWGLDIPDFDLPDAKKEPPVAYSKTIKAPIYNPTMPAPPPISDLYDTSKYATLIQQIEAAQDQMPTELVQFLKFAATRHIVFDYEKTAEFYAHAGAAIQDLMEKSALVIIDFDKAIENGFITLSQDLFKLYSDQKNADTDEA